MVSVVEYRVGTYEGTVTVTDVDPDEETETVLARARRIVTRQAGGTLPPGSMSWREVDRRDTP